MRTNPVEVIKRKRDGKALSAAELDELIKGFLAGEVADYQLTAFLMAVTLRGMTEAETVALTEAMLRSGDRLALSRVRDPKIDKHSTGGVGDKVSLCLAPLVAACGVAVPMVAGRGLGHTGGTLDKLEAIAGYDTRLSPRRFEQVVRQVGTSIIGQTERLAPADRRLYALRDVTGTVESLPLIVASILSKKLAVGLDGLVLDVKVGRGAFMKDLNSARALARALVRVSRHAGLKAVALLTDMSAPIGRTVGNALETREAIEVLHGRGPSDTVELTLSLGEQMLCLAGVAANRRAARRRLRQALECGAGLERLARLVRAQGGDARVVEQPERLPKAPKRVPVTAPRAGTVVGWDPYELGLICVEMGGGRTRADQAIDPRVGLELVRCRGEQVSRGEPVAILHLAHLRQLAELERRVQTALTLERTGSASAPPLVLGRIAR